MPDRSRTAARDLLTQAAEAGVAPLLLAASPWALRKDLLPLVLEASRLPVVAGLTTRAAAPSGQPVTAGVAVIPLTGIITPQGSFFSFLYGGAPGGLQAFRDAFNEAVNSPDVSAILIDVDSPGGLVDMVPETHAEILEARGTKPIVAIADTQMCSAAYWIASAADEIVATKSGYAGSIGAYRVHEDYSRFNSDMGVDVTYVHAGKYKVEGNSDEPLGADGLQKWQQDVDDAYAMFVADVAAGRGIPTQQVIDDYGEGRTLNAQRALDAGLVDRIDDYDAVIGALLGRPSDSPSARALAAQSAELLQAQQAAGDTDQSTGAPDPDEPTTPALSAEDRAAIAAQLLAG